MAHGMFEAELPRCEMAAASSSWIGAAPSSAATCSTTRANARLGGADGAPRSPATPARTFSEKVAFLLTATVKEV